jgi:hypothetical protein
MDAGFVGIQNARVIDAWETSIKISKVPMGVQAVYGRVTLPAGCP